MAKLNWLETIAVGACLVGTLNLIDGMSKYNQRGLDDTTKVCYFLAGMGVVSKLSRNYKESNEDD